MKYRLLLLGILLGAVLYFAVPMKAEDVLRRARSAGL